MLQTKTTADDLVARARDLAPLIAAQADNAQAQRDIPAASAAALREAGLFRLYQPAEWGGYECTPDIFMDVQDLFGEICLSHAWVQSVLAVQSLVVARFDREAQADVWGKDPYAVVASATHPFGKAVPVAGGYRVSGRWGFSSGSSAADWMTVHALTPPGEAGAPPEMKLLLVPKRDFRIADVWHSFGLRGTGSNDIIVEDVFVPAHRSHIFEMGILNVTSAESSRARLYRLPWLPFFPLAIANIAIGGGRGALRRFREIARKRLASVMKMPGFDEAAMAEIGPMLECEIDQIDQTTRAGVQLYLDHVDADTVIPMEDALRFRIHTSAIVRRITALVEKMTLMAGAGGVMQSEPLTRIWLDLCAARLHPGNNPAGAAQSLGKLQLGSDLFA